MYASSNLCGYWNIPFSDLISNIERLKQQQQQQQYFITLQLILNPLAPQVAVLIEAG